MEKVPTWYELALMTVGIATLAVVLFLSYIFMNVG
jgi:hypothetical protein